MKWLLYNFLFSIAYLCMMPKFLTRMIKRGGYANRFADRFGHYPTDILAKLRDGTPRIWIHAVSVGEVFVAHQMMAMLRQLDPSAAFVLSTTSSTGWVQAGKALGERDVLLHNPLDYPRCVKRALDAIQPRAYIVTETELWPNMIRHCQRRAIPTFLINARISDHSAPGYRRLRWWFGPVLNMFTQIFAQSDLDKQRLVDAGCDETRIEVTGSMKFDVAKRNPAQEAQLREYLQGIGFDADAPILLGGSTWPGEDEAMVAMWRAAREMNPRLRLVIVPRHFEKAAAVADTLQRLGVTCARKSQTIAPDQCTDPESVLIADTTGELMGFYGISTIVFVGKSLCEHGAQNMIEPCLCGCATVLGPYTENFRPVMSDLLAAEALVQCPDLPTLCHTVQRFAVEDDTRSRYATRAQQAVARRRGASEHIASAILHALTHRSTHSDATA